VASGPVVFLVLSHHKLPLVERLLRRLTETESAVSVVHHDAKATALPALPGNGRALFVPDPLTCGWADITFSNAILHSMHWIRKEIPNVSWIVLVSGQDYPAMSPARIESELLQSRADAFIHWEFVPPVATRRSTDWQRVTSHRYYWLRLPGTHRFVPVPLLRFYVDGVGTFAGSTWWNLGRRAVDRILDNSVMTRYLAERRFRSALAPDEAFFHTALLNSAADLHLVNSHRRFYRFLKTDGSAHPETLTIRALDAILASGAFFARKVEEHASAELLDGLDAVFRLGDEA
jgi:Core-2/I-Branching enzyme